MVIQKFFVWTNNTKSWNIWILWKIYSVLLPLDSQYLILSHWKEDIEIKGKEITNRKTERNSTVT